jgi:anti-sigma B factor antagonist
LLVQGCEVRVSVDDDGGIVLHVVGEIDLATLPLLRDAFDSIPEIGVRRVVLDLRGVTFFGAGAVRVALQAQERLSAEGADLVLRAPNPFVMRVLVAAGVDHEFRIDQRPTDAPT